MVKPAFLLVNEQRHSALLYCLSQRSLVKFLEQKNILPDRQIKQIDILMDDGNDPRDLIHIQRP